MSSDLSQLSLAAALWQLPLARTRRRTCFISPFVRGLGTLSLPVNSFGTFLADDSNRLQAMLRSCDLAGSACKAAGLEDFVARIDRVRQAVAKELEVHATFSESLDDAVTEPPAKHAHSSQEHMNLHSEFDALMQKCSGSEGAPEMAKMLMHLCLSCAPRFQLLSWLATCLHTVSKAEASSTTPAQYGKWIQHYSSDSFVSTKSEVEAFLQMCGSEEAIEVGSVTEDRYLMGLDAAVSCFTARAELASNVAVAASGGSDVEWLRDASIVPPRVLIVAGSDSGGGAGIQADMKACDAHGVFSTTAVTALTAQNTHGVQGIHPIPSAFIKEQMKSVLSDIGTDAVKTGMLATEEIVSAVADQLRAANPIQGRPLLVVDPVMVSTSGHKLLEDAAIESVKQLLLPQALIITPNTPEASLLLGGRAINNLADMEQAARDLCAMGPRWVLLKGGHMEGSTEATDVLCNRITGECMSFSAKFIATRNTHGTGCTLGSSIAARLARGDTVEEAVREAKRYVNGAINASVHLGLGSGVQGPMNHIWERVEW